MSLLETVLCAALFLTVFLVTFSVFDLGSYNFRVGLMRQGIQGDIRKSWIALERDLRETVLSGCSYSTGLARQVTVPLASSTLTVERDVLCMTSLSQWSPNSITFDPNSGLPLWDRYIIYQATLDNPDGALYRLEIAPQPSMDTSNQFPSFPVLCNTIMISGVPVIGPCLGGKVTGSRRLASGVLSFSVNATSTINVYLKLRDSTNAQSLQSNRQESCEVNLSIAPNNYVQ